MYGISSSLPIFRVLSDKRKAVQILLWISYLGTGLFLLYDYFIQEPVTLFAVVILPFIIRFRNEKETSLRFILPAMIFLALAFFLQIKSFFLLAFLMSLMLFIESTIGRMNNLPLIVPLIISHLFTYFTHVLGFSLRLLLSSAAAFLLSLAGFESEAAGNIIYFKGNPHSVGPACAGLNMLNMTLLITLFLLGMREKTTGKVYSFFHIFLTLGLAFLLCNIANLARILVLVLFNIPADEFGHDLAGIICLGIYCLIPIWFFLKLIKGRSAKENVVGNRKKYLYLNILPLVLLLSAATLEKKNDLTDNIASSIYLPGYEKNILNNGVISLSNENCLIYIKPLPGFYAADHNPLVCWKGSGYQFLNSNMEKIANRAVAVGELKKDNDRLFTSWWFDNGEIKTGSQINWRFHALTGAPGFCLINVSSPSKEIMEKETKKLIDRNIFMTYEHNK